MIDVRLQLNVLRLCPGGGPATSRAWCHRAVLGIPAPARPPACAASPGWRRAADGFIQVNNDVWQDSRSGLFVPPHKRALGYVFQEASLFPHLSVRANLEFGLKRIPRQQRRVDMAQATELLGIGHLLERNPPALVRR